MRDLTDERTQRTIAAIDRANAEDPTEFEGRPLALVQGERATFWIEQLAPEADHVLRLAGRAHHLRRWELPRSDFAPGRTGYLSWRKQNKAHQAAALAALMTQDGWPAGAIIRAEHLLRRANLRTDADTQTLEDAACLVFLETQFEGMSHRFDRDHLVRIVAKTLKKMSADAVTLARSISQSTTASAVLADAVSLTAAEEAHDI